jgi:hypothetical protein
LWWGSGHSILEAMTLGLGCGSVLSVCLACARVQFAARMHTHTYTYTQDLDILKNTVEEGWLLRLSHEAGRKILTRGMLLIHEGEEYPNILISENEGSQRRIWISRPCWVALLMNIKSYPLCAFTFPWPSVSSSTLA